jgi:hypothetical protein
LRRTVDAVMGAREHVVHPSHRKDLDRRDVLGLREARDQVLAGLNERVATLQRDLRPKDLAQFFISTSISMLLGVIPGTDEPETARRYIDVFVLPAIVAHPPHPRPVFPGADDES